jgi:hypothetical protein
MYCSKQERWDREFVIFDGGKNDIKQELHFPKLVGSKRTYGGIFEWVWNNYQEDQWKLEGKISFD